MKITFTPPSQVVAIGQNKAENAVLTATFAGLLTTLVLLSAGMHSRQSLLVGLIVLLLAGTFVYRFSE